MNSPFPPRPLGDEIAYLQSLIQRNQESVSFQEKTLETAAGHVAAGRWTPEQGAWIAAAIHKQIASLRAIGESYARDLAALRKTFAAQVADQSRNRRALGAAFDRWAAQRHAANLAGQPAPEPVPEPAPEPAPAPEPEAQPVAEEGGANE